MSTSKKNIAATGLITYRQLYNAIGGSGPGLQNYLEIVNFLTYKQVMVQSTVGGAAVNSDIRTSAAPIFALQPYQKITGSKDQTATPIDFIAAGFSIRQDRVIVKSITCTVDVGNNSNHGTFLDLELYKCTRDGTRNPFIVAQDLYSIQATTTVSAPALTGAALNAGVAIGAATGHNTYFCPGVKLTHAHTLPAYWKPCTGKAFFLAAGAQQRFNITIVMNKVIKMEDFVGKSAEDFIKGYSLSLVARVMGQVVVDKTTATREPTYGAANLSFITNVVYHLGTMKDAAGRLNLDYAARGIPAGAAGTDQLIIDYSDDVADYIAVA